MMTTAHSHWGAAAAVFDEDGNDDDDAALTLGAVVALLPLFKLLLGPIPPPGVANVPDDELDENDDDGALTLGAAAAVLLLVELLLSLDPSLLPGSSKFLMMNLTRMMTTTHSH